MILEDGRLNFLGQRSLQENDLMDILRNLSVMLGSISRRGQKRVFESLGGSFKEKRFYLFPKFFDIFSRNYVFLGIFPGESLSRLITGAIRNMQQVALVKIKVELDNNVEHESAIKISSSNFRRFCLGWRYLPLWSL